MPRRAWRKLQTAVQRGIAAFWLGRLLRALAHEVAEDDIGGMAAEMAYRFLFAIFPLLLFLVSALGFVGDALGLDNLFDLLLAQARPFVPASVLAIVEEYVRSLLETRSETFLTIGLLGTLWGAATGIGTLIKGLNRVYDVDVTRPLWQQQLLALLVTLTVPPVGLLLFGLVVVGQTLADWLKTELGLDESVDRLIAFLRGPGLFLFLVILLSLLYYILPNVRHPYRWTLPGSLVAAGGWVGLTYAYSLYVANFGAYNATYGSFGAAIGFLLWLYLVGVVVLLGGELNALLEPQGRWRWEARPKEAAARVLSQQ